MVPLAPVRRPWRRPGDAGTTLIEVVVSLALLAMVCASFAGFATRSAGTDAELRERAAGERVLAHTVALLEAEDPWAAPATRRYPVTAGGWGSSDPGTAEVAVTGTVLCAGGAAPDDGAASASVLEPGRCADGTRAVRRWQVEVAYPASFREGGRDTLRSTLDVERTPGSAGWSTGGMIP